MQLAAATDRNVKAKTADAETALVVAKKAAKILSHLGRWDRNFPHPTFFEVGGIENFPIPLLSRQVG